MVEHHQGSAENGILFKNGGTLLEHASRVRVVVLDKTGTITQGAGVTDVVAVAGALW
ncbi:MAG: hypothetical protein H6643_11660 [Caldilineaceae bacterium]|nr:hypothetical protein [Caldilineaceae bacterium]